MGRDWLTYILEHETEISFVGEEYATPRVGDTVRVIRGALVGTVAEVVYRGGSAWGPLRIFLARDEKVLGWLWPWDVEVEPS